MNQQWQVCELEESSKISLTLFERFSVVSVPEKWVLLLEDGTLVCFWPKNDVIKKIRSLHVPKDGEECAYYKCRILLDGAKFSTYKKAKQAELIAQNVSSILDSSVLLESQNAENICESTMDFDVSDAHMEKNEESTDSKGNDFDVTTMDDENVGYSVGNDSFEYNEAMLKRPYFSKKSKAMTFEIMNIADEMLPKGSDETKFSDVCDYDANFKSAGANFLTSTVIDEMDFPANVNTSTVSDALLKISAVEVKVSSFVNDMLSDLNKFKEILRGMENVGGKNGTEEMCSKEVATVHSFASKRENIGDLADLPQPASKTVQQSGESNEARYSNEIGELVQREKMLLPPSTDTHLEECHYDDDFRNINEIFVLKPVPDLYLPAVPITENVSMSVVTSQPEKVIVPITEEVPVAAVASVESTPENVIKLPVNSIAGHTRNENLLIEDEFEEAMIKHLAALDDENEACYMNRTILIVFTKDFLLKNVSWKKQEGRINIKNSLLVSCWMESYRKAFNVDVDSKKFQDHFRRFKNTLRAAIKADLKRELDGNVKAKAKRIRSSSNDEVHTKP